MKAWSHIVIHHSLTKDSGTVSWDAIRKFHTVDRGWQDVGYHWGVELVGDQVEVLVGRPMWIAGAHTKELSMNQHAVGICYVGNFDLEPPGEARLAAADRLVRWLMHLYQIPAESILGHREVGLLAGYDWQDGDFKSCPGALFDMDDFRARYAEEQS